MAAAKKTIREVPISEFKARCLAMVDRVRRGKEEILITKRGKPVAKVVGLEASVAWPDLGGLWAGKVNVVGDIVHSDWSDELETMEEWDALNGSPKA